MGGSSSKRLREVTEFQELIVEVDKYTTDLAKTLDSLHDVANDFISQLEDKEAGLADISCSNVERLFQKLVNLYGTAVHLLIAIEAGKQKKEYMVDQVNRNLHTIRMKLERVYKRELKGLPELSSDSYLREQDATNTSFSEPQSERGRKIMDDSISSMRGKSGLHLQVQNLEEEVLKMKETINLACLEKSGKELEKVEATKEQSEAHKSKTHSEKDTNKVDTEVEELRLEVDRFRTEREKLANETVILRRNMEKLDQELGVVKTQVKRKEADIMRLNEELRQEKSSSMMKDHFTREIQSQNASLEKEKQLLQEESNKVAKNSEDRNRDLEYSNRILQQENKEMKEELEKLKSRTLIQVQLYSQTRGDLITAIEEELMVLLKSRMNKNNSEPEFIKCVSPNHIQDDKPLLLLCINASRLGTDVSKVLQGIHVTSKVAVLVFHHKDVHALPSQASDRVLSGPQFRGIGGIFDIAFLSGKGIYSCEMNDSNVINVMNFIQRP